MVSKNEEIPPLDSVTKTLQETLSNKIDLDKLYQENTMTQNQTGFVNQVPMNQGHFNNHNQFNQMNGNRNQFNQMNNNQFNQMNNNQFNPNHNQFNQINPNYPPQQFYNNNYGPQMTQMNNQFHQSYDVNFNNSSNIKVGENYTPLDMKDYNQPSKLVTSEPKKEPPKEHQFDFVSDLMKKKK